VRFEDLMEKNGVGGISIEIVDASFEVINLMDFYEL
jgi:hypothetical protein